jgi:hypothetical protein
VLIPPRPRCLTSARPSRGPGRNRQTDPADEAGMAHGPAAAVAAGRVKQQRERHTGQGTRYPALRCPRPPASRPRARSPQ